MCGICFAIRPSATYPYFGQPPWASTMEAASSPTSSSTSHSGSQSTAVTGSSDASTTSSPASTSTSSTHEAGYYLDAPTVWETLCAAVQPRGPDASSSLIRWITSQPGGKGVEWEMRAYVSVLHMRGGEHGPPTKQPFVGEGPDGDVLLFNGEIFDGLKVPPGSNDGQTLFNLLQKEGATNFFSVIRSIEGPYALVYYQADHRRVYFARDPLGRRSLVMHYPTKRNSTIYLSSCACAAIDGELDNWQEVPCDSVFAFHLADIRGRTWDVDNKRGLSAYPRYSKSMGLSPDILVYPFDPLLRSIPTPSDLTPYDPKLSTDKDPRPLVTAKLHLAIQALTRELEASLRKRILDVPAPLHLVSKSSTAASLANGQQREQQEPRRDGHARIAVLFSGGLDCTTLALLADRVLPLEHEIDLINVAFENPRIVAGQETERLKNAKAQARVGGGRNKRKTTNQARVGPVSPIEDMSDLMDSIDASVLDSDQATADPSLALAGDAEAEVDEQPALTTAGDDSSVYDVPDRITGRATWQELRELRPRRRWNFVEVNVPYDEMLEHRPKVLELMRPQKTVMDLSISLAFYFAARGVGQLAATDAHVNTEPYRSTARVLLSGLGADELLGGYARHRRAYFSPPGTTPGQPRPPAANSDAAGQAQNGSSSSSSSSMGNWAAVIAELQVDLDRLPTRNLGRDDRIIAHHGKEARYPFLAGSVVDFITRLPVWIKMDFRFAEGVGDKMLLRLVARQLGLIRGAELKKRAIHFGARTAKMEIGSGKDKGETLL